MLPSKSVVAVSDFSDFLNTLPSDQRETCRGSVSINKFIAFCLFDKQGKSCLILKTHLLKQLHFRIKNGNYALIMFFIVLRSIIQTCILMRTCTKSNCFIHSWGHGEVPAIIVNMNYCLITEFVAKAQFKAELIGVKSTSNHCTCHF